MKANEGKCLLIIRNNEYVSFKSGVQKQKTATVKNY